MVDKKYYAYTELVVDVKDLSRQLEGKYDALLVVARGGMCFGHLLAEKLELRDVSLISLASYDETVQRDTVTIQDMPRLDNSKRYLVVEDIVDSGKSMEALSLALKEHYPDLNYDVAALFYKKTASYKPQYFLHEATQWIEFFWEVDI